MKEYLIESNICCTKLLYENGSLQTYISGICWHAGDVTFYILFRAKCQ